MILGQGLYPCSLIFFVIAVIVTWCFYRKERLPNVLEQSARNRGVIIGILSARENFEHRDASRRSWIKFLNDSEGIFNKSISHKFIVGMNNCEIPPEDRINKYVCKWDPYVETFQDGDSNAYSMGDISSFHKERQSIGLDFEVMHPIVINKLGILAFTEKNVVFNPVRVTIFDRVAKTEIVSTVFNKSYPMQHGFWLRVVDSYMLPSEFKGSVVVDAYGGEFHVAKSEKPCIINDGGGLLKFHKVTRHGAITGYLPSKVVERNTFCSHLAGTFTYKSHGAGSWVSGQTSKKIGDRIKRLDQWTKKLQKENKLLAKENSKNGDILFVNVKDYYRNVPRKLLEFYKWVSSQHGVQFTIKTDDDCYLNIPRIVQEIDLTDFRRQDKVWFGSFRSNWPVELFGKWAENEFTASEYPAFACGSGNILSRSVIEWISMNSNYFHIYQGEDVSMGIWLSAILPKIKNDERWSCFKLCNKEIFSLPNNNADELEALYDNHLKCNNPCSCNQTYVPIASEYDST